MSATVPNEKAAPGSRHKIWRRLLRWFAIFVLVPYLAIVLLFAVFQRSLIYQGTKSTETLAAASQFPPGQGHDVAIRTNDGLELFGWHILPDGKTASTPEQCAKELADARWLLLYFPGNAGNRSHRYRDLRDFTSLGMHVLLVDYRGYAENPGAPSEASLAADARALWKFSTGECHVPAERILLFGESLGGGVATRLASEVSAEGHAPAGLILSSTFSSLIDAANWHYPLLPARLVLLDRFESAERIAAVTCPIVILHGDQDDIVPIELGEKLFAAAPAQSASGVAKTFIELEGAGHNNIPRGELRNAVERLLDLLGQ